MKLQYHQIDYRLNIGGAVHRRLFVFLILVLLPVYASAYSSFTSDSKHNFADDGFAGGGVCSECHAAGGGAGDNRLFWLASGGSDPGMCYKCHKASPTRIPNQAAEWLAVSGYAALGNSGGVLAPAMPHDCVNGRCARCHDGVTVTAYYRCLDCHKTGGVDAVMCRTSENYDSGSATNPVQSEVAKFFTGIAGYSPMSGLLSSHNIIYNEAGNLSNSTDNECLKCHGLSAATAHPGVKANSPILRYPDDPDGAGALTINGSILRPQGSDEGQWNDYYIAKRQTFCLACHDGVANQAGAQITFGSHAIPVVPPFKFDLSSGNDAAAATPYFADGAGNNFFEGNGHGRTLDRRSIKMNLTCLGEEPKSGDVTVTGVNAVGTGCHSAHGSKNYSLIRDAASDGSVDLGTGVDTAAEMATKVCLGCHSRSVMRTYKDFSKHPGSDNPADGEDINTGFHVGWGSGYRMSHLDGACDNVTAGNMNDNSLNSGGVFWRALPAGNSMATGVPASMADVLPVFSSKTANLKSGRSFVRDFDGQNCSQSASSTGSAINCLTCHDPHGTSSVYQEGERGPPIVYGTKGMTRRPLTDTDVYKDPVDPLCGQCHID